MLISVVIPAYNCIATLERTLESILHSGLSDYEVLLIDDGSNDGAADLCEELQRRFDCVRCVHQTNAGVSAARNRGIREAAGTYILFFDADDTVDADALCHCEAVLRQHNPDMLIFGLSFDYYFHGSMYRRDELVPPLEGLVSRERWLGEMTALFESNALSPVWNKMIRRNLLLENRIQFPGGMIEMEDFLFSVRCLRYCGDIWFLPEPIYRYRQPEDESNTYRRLCRIPSISGYMDPFEAELAAMPGTEGIAGKIYASFLGEMIRFSDIFGIEKTAKDMFGGKYAPWIAAENPGLYQLLEEGKYRQIWMKSQVGRLRHWTAVRVKYFRKGRGHR